MAKSDHKLKIVHVVASLSEVRGGPPRSVINLCQSLSKIGCKIEIVTLDDTSILGKPVPYDINSVTVHRVPCKFIKTLDNFYAPSFYNTLNNIAKDADVIHSHGLWLPVNNSAAKLSKKLNLPHVISIRGNLQEAALRSSQVKKMIARFLFVNSNLREARCLHATSEAEAQFIRSNRFINPIANIPIGVSVPNLDTRMVNGEFEKRWPELKHKRLLLYLGRLNAHKGVISLAEAWTRIASRFPDWHLVIAGPDENGCGRRAKEILKTNNSLDSCLFTGPVSGEGKSALLARCELLVLPSRSENFGNVVAEALAVGRPVLTTVTTPWQDLETYRCGWQINVGTDPLFDKLNDILCLSTEHLNEIGKNGINLIRKNYNLNEIAENMKMVYEWLAFNSYSPSCVDQYVG